jgi:hypothetical protein
MTITSDATIWSMTNVFFSHLGTIYAGLKAVGGNQPIKLPYLPYGHPFIAASWYYAEGIDTDVVDVRRC